MNLIIKDINVPLEPGTYNATLQIDEDGAARIHFWHIEGSYEIELQPINEESEKLQPKI